MSLKGKKILVTGATGFIGGRLVESLIQNHGCQVRALVHNFANAPYIARFPIEMVPGDIADEMSVSRAAQGCDVIIHTATGTSPDAATRRRATVEGTETVLKVALAAHIKRVVYFSTISVYGMLSDGDLNEQSPAGRLPDEYSRNKSDAENLALDYYRTKGVPVVVLQPTVVYGPYGQSWTVIPLMALRNEQVIIPEEGLCNAVYIDDVVEAAIRSAYIPEAVGQRFLISAAEPVTWKEFYGAYEDMLGFRSTVCMTQSEYERERRWLPVSDFTRDFVSFLQHPKIKRRIQSTFLLRGPYTLVNSLVPHSLRDRLKAMTEPTKHSKGKPAPKPRRLPDKDRFRWLAAKARVRIDKAKEVLGYVPQYNLREGMRRTHLWAEWAGYLD